MTGLYIHIPFCRGKCPYCDFYSSADRKNLGAYTGALCAEIESLAGCAEFAGTAAGEKCDTVYFGGGTPSEAGAGNIKKILSAAAGSFEITPDAEITVECNPSTPDIGAFLPAVREAGANRLSFGMQSAVDSERRALGRLSDSERISFCIAEAKKAGFDNISLDVMLGIPRQTKQSLKYTLDFALSENISHLSAYMLQLEEGTRFYKMREKLELPDEDETADLYQFMCAYLEEKGMRHYEISNFCFGGRVSRHNMKYWQLDNYLGFGPGAHSFYNGKRFYYPRSTEDFTASPKAVYEGEGGGYEEYVMLSLRLGTGLDTEALRKKYGVRLSDGFGPLAASLTENGLAVMNGGSLILTSRGMAVSNSVINAVLDRIIL